MSIMVQYIKYDDSLLNSRKCSEYDKNKLSHENQFAKSVESALYAYPVWKVNFEQCKSLYDNHIFEAKCMNSWHGDNIDEIGVLKQEYVIRIKLIEETMMVLSPMQRTFVKQRYFEKMPFKIIAEEMSVAERHLYRIRQNIIRIFAISFGW